MFSRRTPSELSLNAVAQALGEGEDVLDLTVSNPTRVGLAYPEKEILAALGGAAALAYEPDPRGRLGAREALRAHLAAKGIDTSTEKIFLTASTSEAYTFLFKLLCDPGDEVLVPEPSYPLLEHLLALECCARVPYALRAENSWRIDFDSLEGVLSTRTRAVCLIQPNNPTGNYLTEEERGRLVRIARERNLALISDEVFFDYPQGRRPSGARSLAGESGALTFALGGLSKSLGLPQLKLGWIVASGPDEILSEALERLELIADTYLSVSAPVQVGLEKLLALEPRIQRAISERVASNRRVLAEALQGVPGARLLECEGGWYAMIRLGEEADEEQLVLALLEQDRVLVQPGYFFDCSEGAHLVLSLLAPLGLFREGVGRLAARLSNQ